jgi:hypothetical protein
MKLGNFTHLTNAHKNLLPILTHHLLPISHGTLKMIDSATVTSNSIFSNPE